MVEKTMVLEPGRQESLQGLPYTIPHLSFGSLPCPAAMGGALDNFYCSVECLSL